MTNQEILNEASREYILLQEYIKKLVKENNKKTSEKEVLDTLDITMQVVLLYLAVSNMSVPDIELTFIRLLTTEKDIVDAYNKERGTNYTWNSLRKENMKPEELKEYISKTYSLFKPDIDKFVGLLSGCDSLTEEDNLEYITDKFRNILNLFTDISNDTNKEYINLILNEIFINKYKALKNIFQSINFSL